TIHPWHAQVGENDLWIGPRLQSLECGCAVARLADHRAPLCEKARHGTADQLFVVDEEHAEAGQAATGWCGRWYGGWCRCCDRGFGGFDLSGRRGGRLE